MRSSPAPNYGEARGAESYADFVHKVRIVLKELNETSVWLRVFERSQMLRRELIMDIIGDNLRRSFIGFMESEKAKPFRTVLRQSAVSKLGSC